jgi:hypothetical protein
MTTERIGPFEESYYSVVVDGYLVPNIKAYKTSENGWKLVLGDRFSILVTEAEINAWLWWVANAMAIAAGYTSFGENCQPSNPFTCRAIGISLEEIGDK